MYLKYDQDLPLYAAQQGVGLLYTKIKICGITRETDAMAAASAGADAIGFVFHRASPRYIEPKQANVIAQMLPPFISKVGVLVAPSREEVQALLSCVELDFLQLNGDENESLCESYRYPYIKGVRIRDVDEVVSEAKRFPQARALLLDSYVEGEYGGTGTRFLWKPLPEIDKPIILAGGLNHENVASAVSMMSPYGVDVSSGVEKDKGIKDADKIREFIRSVRNTCDPSKL